MPSSVPTCLFFGQNQTHKYCGTFSLQCHSKSDSTFENVFGMLTLDTPWSCCLTMFTVHTRWAVTAHRRARGELSAIDLASILASPVFEVMWVKGRTAALTYRRGVPSPAVCDQDHQDMQPWRALEQAVESKLPPKCLVTSAMCESEPVLVCAHVKYMLEYVHSHKCVHAGMCEYT